MHIKNVEIQNFKSIEHLTLGLSNLTLIAGANSVGKSTFIQALLLLKQNEKAILECSGYKKSQEIDGMSINGKLVELGHKSNLLFIEAKNDFIDIAVSTVNRSVEIQFDSYVWRGLQKGEPVEKSERHMMFMNEINLFNAKKFTYLHTNRTPPQMTYALSEDDINKDSLGVQGEYTAHFLAKNKHRKLSIDKLKHKNSITNLLLENVSKWMGEITDKIDITATANENIMQATLTYSYVYGKQKTKELNPLNVGFGVSYVLPVITALLKAKPDDIVLIENPEAHLHPKGQANLARLIAIAASNNVQIILETHSDHILNGIRVATREGDIKKEQTKVYYFNKKVDALAVQAQEVTIESDGSISDWPAGFFDEWDNQLGKLLW